MFRLQVKEISMKAIFQTLEKKYPYFFLLLFWNSTEPRKRSFISLEHSADSIWE
jgi:hypothetical protein